MRLSCIKAGALLILLSLAIHFLFSKQLVWSTSRPSLTSEQQTWSESNDLRSGFDFFLKPQKLHPSTAINNAQLNSAFISGMQTHIKVANNAPKRLFQ